MRSPPVNHTRSQMPLLSWIYVGSIVLQPMNLFIFADSSTSGLTISASRFLQAAVLIGLSFRVASVAVSQRSATRLAVPSTVNPLYRDYIKYFCLTVAAGLVGVASGAYDLPTAYDFRPEATQTVLSRFLFQPVLRPLIEYFISAYYFVYFVVLPAYLLRRQKDVGYLLSAFKAAVVVSLVVGAAGSWLPFIGEILPRNLADFRSPGNRFHGLFGEPKDAFGYLFLGLAMLHLGAFHKGLALRKIWAVVIIAAAIESESASGLVGIVCFVGLYAIYSLRRISIRSALQLVGLASLVAALLYGSFVSSQRLVVYGESISGLWAALENRERLPDGIAMVNNEIYPLYDVSVKWRNLEMLPIVIGSGFGSASAVNNRLSIGIPSEHMNPQSQLVRTIYESGLVGLYYFVMAFVRPVQRLTKRLPSRVRHRFIVLSLLVIGCCLGNRNVAPFIYLGAVVAMFRARQDQVARMSG